MRKGFASRVILIVTAICLLYCVTTNGVGQATLQFGTSSYSVPENVGNAVLAVVRAGDANTAVGVDYATVDGSATNGLKYTAVSGTLAFGANETRKSIIVPIL